MVGQFGIRMIRNQKEILVDKILPDGIVLRDLDPFPRRGFLALEPRGNVTPKVLKDLKRLKRWRNKENVPRPFITAQGRLTFVTPDPEALPRGSYSFRFGIEDLPISRGRFDFRITKSEDIVEIPVGQDPRTIRIRDTFAQVDQKIKTVLDDAGSVVDGLTLPDWLKTAFIRSKRKACVFNILAVLRTSPNIDNPLIDQIRNIFFIAPDRVYSEVTPSLVKQIQDLVKTTVFYSEHEPSSVHRRLLERVPGLDPDDFVLRSFRQEGRPSMQLCIGSPKIDPENSPHYADIDLDLGNPLQDFLGFLIHMGELLDADRTDHLDLHDDLDEVPTKEFLYYDVVEV